MQFQGRVGESSDEPLLTPWRDWGAGGQCQRVGSRSSVDRRAAADADDLAAWLESHGAKSATELADGPGEGVAPDDGDQAASAASHLLPATEGQPAGFALCFPTRDLRAALTHYEQLGFTVMNYTAGATWGWVRFEHAEIHLNLKQDHDAARTAAAADLTIVGCDALERQWSATGVPGTSDPYDTPHGRREAVHVDLDNNLIRFGSPIPDP